MLEKFIKNAKDNNFFKLINFLITTYCLIIIYQKIESKDFYEILDSQFINVLFLIYFSSIGQSLAWSILISNKINIIHIHNWMYSNIGKYIPFKVGVFTKRLIDNNLIIDSRKLTKGIVKEQIYILLPTLIFGSFFYFKLEYFLISLITLLIILKKIFLSNNLKIFSIYFLSELIYLFAVIKFFSIYFQSQLIELSILYLVSAAISLFIFTAPAGIGVREYVFLNLTIFFNFAAPNLISILLGFRIITILSDILVHLTSFYTRRLLNKKFK